MRRIRSGAWVERGRDTHDIPGLSSASSITSFGAQSIAGRCSCRRLIPASEDHRNRDASWAQLAAMLDYKAASAGVEFVRVGPRGTSQECPQCGQIAAKALDERRHRCDCGADIDRDVAAAMVVHFRAFGFSPGSGLESLSERVAA